MLLSAIHEIPEYRTALEALQRGEHIALTGVGQICRSHFIAGLHRSENRPIVAICADDLTAKRLQEDLTALCGMAVPSLPSREFTPRNIKTQYVYRFCGAGICH